MKFISFIKCSMTVISPMLLLTATAIYSLDLVDFQSERINIGEFILTYALVLVHTFKIPETAYSNFANIILFISILIGYIGFNINTDPDYDESIYYP